MELRDFFDTVITCPSPEGGFFLLAIGPPATSNWRERWYRWPAQKEEILRAIAETRGEHNVWFSSFLFKAASSVKSNVLPTRTIQADLDDADVATLPIPPTVLVRSSPGRHQAYWVLRGEPLDPQVHEILSRKMTYAIPECDHSGWPLGRKLRVPDTFNFKYLDGPKPVEVIDFSGREVTLDELEHLPDAGTSHTSSAGGDVDDAFLDSLDSLELPIGPLELLESIRAQVGGKVYVQYSSPAPVRHTALWGLMLAGFKAGLSRDQVFWLAKHSANNKFAAELRHSANRELGRDILRAEALVQSQGSDPRDLIDQARRLPGPATFRKQAIFGHVLKGMKERGTFFHTTDESAWYIRRDIGRPVSLATRSEYLDTLLDLEYGLNSTEEDQKFAVAGLCAYAHSLPATTVRTALSYFDYPTRTLLLHSGRKDVYRITRDSIDTMVDGSNGLVFPWPISGEPFVLGAPDPDWGENLFGRSSTADALENLIGLERTQALTLLQAWFVFLLFKSIAPARPLIVTLGQPGSGKSVLFKKVYRMLYGRHKDIDVIGNVDEFDQAVAHYPMVCFDNADSWNTWMPDRLAQCAGSSDITRRKLYTDGDDYVLKRQALVGLTAHNPKFIREDVADRMLLFSFERLDETKYLPELTILDNISNNRSSLWSGVIADIQRMLSIPLPDEGPPFRVEDFARVGLWFARSIGRETVFVDAIASIRQGQRALSLEEDSMLISAVKEIFKKHPDGVEDKTPSQLWGLLEHNAADPQAFVKTYKNSVVLGKKMLTLQDSMKLAFAVTWTYNSSIGARAWTIKPINANGVVHD